MARKRTAAAPGWTRATKIALPEGMIAQYQLGLDGNPVERTPRTHPYNFDAHYHYYQAYEGRRETIHSDRIAQQKRNELAAARLKYPDCWSMERFDLAQAQAALAMIFSKPMTIVAVIQQCNASTGYPIWSFEVIDE